MNALSTMVKQPAGDMADPRARARTLLDAAARWLPLLVVLAVASAVLVRLDVAPLDIVRYAAYASWAVLLPGVLVYRALRRVPHSLVDDLAMGAALGLVLEIGAYVLFSSAGLRGVLWLWPALVVVPFVVLRPLRRHWRPAGYQRAPLLWSWTVAATAVFLLGYLTYAFLIPNAPVPTGAERLYFNDQLYLLSLVGEAKQHFPLQAPQIAPTPLGYHWFTFAHIATASTISGVDTPVVFFRFAVPALCLLGVVLLAAVGWRVTGKPWVGAVASALMYAVGELTLGSSATGPLAAVTAYSVWHSESVPYGWLVTLPMIVFALDRLVGGFRDAPVGRGAWVGFALCAIAGPGAKATVLPVTLAALGLVALVELVRRRRSHRVTWGLIGIVVGAQVFGLAVLYRFESQGMRVSPFGIFYVQVLSSRPGPWWKVTGLYAILLTGYVLYMLTRLAGIPVLARIRGRTWGTVEWFLLGGIAGGTLGTLLLWHQSLSQNHFIKGGFMFGAILSAMGLVALVERHRVPARTMAVVVAVAVGASVTSSLFMWYVVGARGGPGFRGMYPIFQTAAATAVVAVALGGVALLARRRWPGLRGVPSVMVVTVVLTAGLPSLPWDAYLHPNANNYYHTEVSGAQAAAARWLRDNSDPDDLVATNVHCVAKPPGDCLHLNFYPSAFSERRFLVESWGYEEKTDQIATRTFANPATVPFWDAELIAMNDDAIAAPDDRVIDYVYRRGVRWLLVDRGYGREAAEALRGHAELRLDNGRMAVYRLLPPGRTG